MRRLKTSRRFAGLIAALLLAVGITAGSAQTQNRNAHGNTVDLTYTKWFAPSFPHMVGEVEGDIVAQFGGAVLEATPDGGSVRLKAIYIILAPDASRSLTLRLNGAQDIESGTAVLNGRVVDGRLTGARARAQFTVVDCPQSEGPCFQGTITIRHRGGHDADDD